MKTSTCRGRADVPGCGAEIIWATTRSGGKIPLDAKPKPYGTIAIEMDGDEPHAIYVGAMEIEGPKYVSHFATCPHSARFRKR